MEPGFSSTKTYVYNYEGSLMIGHQEKNLYESGLKISSSVEISGVSQQTFLLKVINPLIEEFHGIPEKDRLTSSPKLTQRIAAQLKQPIKFEYIKGRIGTIYAPDEVSNTVLNILKGILNFLQMTIKNTKNVYNLQEPGIHGICYTSYVLEEDKKASEIYVTRSIDLQNCQEKAMKIFGMAYAPACENCKKVGKNAEGIVTYSYVIKPTEDGSLITKAYARELQQFAPVNIKGGTSMIKISKKLTLAAVRATPINPPSVTLQSRGTLKYKFGSEINQIPVLLMRTKNTEIQISEVLQRLVQNNQPQVDTHSPTDFLQLVQLLRFTTLENLEALWKQFSLRNDYRRWILDSVVTIPGTNVIKFLKNRIENEDITEKEAVQAILFAFHLMTSDSETIKLSKEFLKFPFIQKSTILLKTMTLVYGSMVYRYCVDREECPQEALQPLRDLAAEASSKADEVQIILALKAIGNAGQPEYIKSIMKFLPGFASSVSEIPLRVQNAAVLALRNIAIKDPRSVQDIVQKILKDRSLHSEVRMHACLVVFETRPPLALVSMIAESMLTETNLQVASFCYSQMKTLTRSTTPDNRELAAACTVALKILGPKFGKLSFRYSKAFHNDYFTDGFLSGVAADFYLMNSAARWMPTTIMHRLKTYFIGTVSDPWELGVRVEGMDEIFKKSSFTEKIKAAIAKVLKMLSNSLSGWKSTPTENALLSTYLKFFGQEVFFADINRNTFHKAMEVLSTVAGEHTYPWKIIDLLQRGILFQWTHAYLASEIRYIESTSLGLPVENSQYYTIMTGMTVNAKTQVHPAPIRGLGVAQLLNSEIETQVDSVLSNLQNFICFHGVNTELIQTGSEHHADLQMAVPLKFDLTMDLKEARFRVEFPSCQKENELLELKREAFLLSSYRKRTEMLETRTKFHHNCSICVLSHKESNATSITGSSSSSSSGSTSNEKGHQGHRRVQWSKSNPSASSSSSTSSSSSSSSNSKRRRGRGNPDWRSSRVLESRWNSNQSSSSSSQELSIPDVLEDLLGVSKFQKARLIDDSMSPFVTAMAEAVRSDGMSQGYEATAYLSPTTPKNKMQLLVSEINEESKWKMCVDAGVEKSHEKTMMVLSWGEDCENYKIATKAEVLDKSASHLALQFKFQWGKIPRHMKNNLERLAEYVPGIALYLGFFEKHQQNPHHQISITIKATSSSTIDTIIKAPKLTLYQQGIPIPVDIPVNGLSNMQKNTVQSALNDLPSLILHGMKAQCSVAGRNFITFNNVRFTSALPKACYHVLAQDCTSELKFVVLMKEEASNKKEVYIRTPLGNLIIHHEAGRDPFLRFNNAGLTLSSLPFKDPSGTLLINTIEGDVLIEAPELGLDRLYLNGEIMKVVIESWMKGKMCGLCGQADGEDRTEFRMPNLYTAKSPSSFVHSWMLHEEPCSACTLQREFVTLQKHISIMGEESSCHSVEPILHCRSDCSPLETTPVSVGFNCIPTESTSGNVKSQSGLSRKTENTQITVQAHTACFCPPTTCKSDGI
ncbi:vitellogenin-like [Lepisosteus oculatus]|uniref:vitellogenin-like n=1 Tax=Lepisosteus oculatus TaxID=7918 RepID=UPI003723763A